MAHFDTAFDRLIGHEGEYVHDPLDPGGETKWGISKRSYPDIDIKNLTRAYAKGIYKKDFWDPLAETLPVGVLFQLFDFAVNSGIHTAIRYMQRALGVADDGVWGPITQAAAARMSETDMVMRLNAERLDFYTRLSTWDRFGKGWVRRVANNLRYGSEDT